MSLVSNHFVGYGKVLLVKRSKCLPESSKQAYQLLDMGFDQKRPFRALFSLMYNASVRLIAKLL